MADAGIDRAQTYVTNVVKHFKWEPRDKRRIYKKPNAREIAACRPWLEAEINFVRPKVIVCLGATATQALLGSNFKVSKQRGQFIESTLAPYIMATVHPSSILRAPDNETRRLEKRRFVNDLKRSRRFYQRPKLNFISNRKKTIRNLKSKTPFKACICGSRPRLRLESERGPAAE